MSFFTNNKTVLMLGSSALALAAGAMYFLTNTKQKKEVQQEYKRKVLDNQNEEDGEYEEKVKRKGRNNNQDLIQNQEIKEDYQQEQQAISEKNQPENSVRTKTSMASSKVRVQLLDGSNNFDFATVAAILESSLDYIDQEYIDYVKRNREERRKVRINDPERYKELVLEYNTQIEKFILTAQDQLLADINIDKDQFDSSVNALHQIGLYQQLYMVQSAMKQKISEKLPHTKVVTKELMREIIKFQLDVLQNQKESFILMISQLQFAPDIAELIPFVLNTMIQDMIFEKFQVEEEDQASQMNVQDIMKDPETHQLLQQIEEAMINMMNQFGLNYIDEQQEIEEGFDKEDEA